MKSFVQQLLEQTIRNDFGVTAKELAAEEHEATNMSDEALARALREEGVDPAACFASLEQQFDDMFRKH